MTRPGWKIRQHRPAPPAEIPSIVTLFIGLLSWAVIVAIAVAVWRT